MLVWSLDSLASPGVSSRHRALLGEYERGDEFLSPLQGEHHQTADAVSLHRASAREVAGGFMLVLLSRRRELAEQG